jgi:hypothetical protein
MKSRRRELHPMTRLAIAMGSAASGIMDPTRRRIAAYDADKIPKCRAEIGGGRRGELARLGRVLLASLSTLPPEQLEDAAERLRAYADAIGSRFEVTSEISLGDRRRRMG